MLCLFIGTARMESVRVAHLLTVEEMNGACAMF